MPCVCGRGVEELGGGGGLVVEGRCEGVYVSVRGCNYVYMGSLCV